MKKYKKLIIIFLAIVMALFIGVFGISFYVQLSTKSQIISEKQAAKLKDIDCVIILGAGVWGDKPSPMLEDRLKMGILLYKNEIVPKILMSGDHGRKEYDEVNLMKDYAIDKGIISEDVFMDHAGFSTYETMYRARDVFKAKKIIIVTQRYHMYRAVYIAKSLGLKAYGVEAEPINYKGAFIREMREILARDKDFVKCIFKPEPTYLGEEILISGNGDATNDKKKNVSE